MPLPLFHNTSLYCPAGSYRTGTGPKLHCLHHSAVLMQLVEAIVTPVTITPGTARLAAAWGAPFLRTTALAGTVMPACHPTVALSALLAPANQQRAARSLIGSRRRMILTSGLVRHTHIGPAVSAVLSPRGRIPHCCVHHHRSPPSSALLFFCSVYAVARQRIRGC